MGYGMRYEMIWHMRWDMIYRIWDMRDGICDMGYEKGYEINDMGYDIWDGI